MRDLETTRRLRDELKQKLLVDPTVLRDFGAKAFVLAQISPEDLEDLGALELSIEHREAIERWRADMAKASSNVEAFHKALIEALPEPE